MDAEPDDLVETGQMIRKKFAIIDKPKVIDLKHANLGLVGTKEVLHEQLEIFVTQLAFFQSYHDLQIIMVVMRNTHRTFRGCAGFLT